MPWPTPASAALVAVLLAIATAALTPAILERLPEPPGSTGKVPYRELRTPGFLATVGGVALAAGLAALPVLPATHWAAWAALVGLGVPAAVIDARTTYLPLPLARASWAGVGLGAVAAALGARDPSVLVGAALGAAVLGGFLHLVWRVSGAIGYGDVRLMVTVGAAAGSVSVGLALLSLLLGTAVGAAWGVAHRVRHGEGPFPYGPGLLTGPFLALLVLGPG